MNCLRRVIRSLGSPWAERRDSSQLKEHNHHHHQQKQQVDKKGGGRRATKKKASPSTSSPGHADTADPDVSAGKITLPTDSPGIDTTAAKGGAKGFFNFFH